MDNTKPLNAYDLTSEAALRGLKMSQVCAEADVSWSTFWRWKKGKTITMASYDKLRKAVFRHPKKGSGI